MAKKSTAIDVTQGVIWQQLLSLCVPIFFSSFFQQAYTLIGTYIVGQFGGKLALGGIQATMVLTELCIGFCVGVGAGCAVITGQYFGQHDDERLSRSVHTAMTLALVGGIVFSILGIVFVEPMLVVMNTPHELLAEGVAYARCYFAAMVAALPLNMGTALLRAVGDTRGPAVIIASGCLVNAVLDVIFVAVLHMEALGCGIAVALTICSNATMIVIRMMHAPGAWRLSLSKLGIDPRICKSMISCGLPLGFQSAAYSISNVLIQVSVNSFGADVTTAWGLSGRLDGIVWMVTEALGVSITTFSAQNLARATTSACARATIRHSCCRLCSLAACLPCYWCSRVRCRVCLSTMLRFRRTPRRFFILSRRSTRSSRLSRTRRALSAAPA